MNPQIDALREQLGIAEELPELEIRYVPSRTNDRPIFENGRVVVFLRDPTASRAENVVKAAMHYVGTSVYPQARPYMNQSTNTALDLAIARRMLQGDRDAVLHYTRYFVQDLCQVDPILNRIYGHLSSIDERGLLPGVLLHQLSALSLRLGYAHHFNLAVQSEVVDFIRFVESIANRTQPEVQLDFSVRYIKISIILLGRDEILSQYGFGPYTKQVARAMMAGFNGVYILAAGRKAKLVRDFLDQLESNEYFRERISDVELEEKTIMLADRKSDRAIGYVSLKQRHTITTKKAVNAEVALVADTKVHAEDSQH